jgi:Fur family ferric uptake transcriptional regulator
MDSYPELERRDIRAAGLRATSSRIAVLRLLRSCHGPLTHAEVTERLADGALDKVTVYRNLIDLAEAGMLRRIAIGNTYRFESPHEHPSPTPVHFVCTRCKTVQCLSSVSLPTPRGRDAPRSMKRGDVEVHIRGICDACA